LEGCSVLVPGVHCSLILTMTQSIWGYSFNTTQVEFPGDDPRISPTVTIWDTKEETKPSSWVLQFSYWALRLMEYTFQISCGSITTLNEWPSWIHGLCSSE
jgi:hypothetical protein